MNTITEIEEQLDRILGTLSDDDNHDPEYWEIVEEQKAAILTLITKALEAQDRESRIDELGKILHLEVCEVMCGWSKKCDVQGEICPKIRKRLAQLQKPNEQENTSE